MNTIRPVRAVCAVRPSTAALTKRHLAHLIRSIDYCLLVGRDLARDGDVARRDVHDGVVGEEVAWTQQERHRLGRHDGEVLRRRDVRHAEGVPEDNVRVVDRLAALADPLRQAARRLPGGLRDVTAGGPELVIRVCGVVVSCQHLHQEFLWDD